MAGRAARTAIDRAEDAQVSDHPPARTGERIVAIAEARSTAARARLSATLSRLQTRLSPKALAQEAASTLLEKGKDLAAGSVDAAKRNPTKAAGTVAAVGLFLARRPLTRLVHRLLQNGDDATPAKPASLKPERRTAAAKRKSS